MENRRFDAVANVVCEGCGSIINIKLPELPDIPKEVKEQFSKIDEQVKHISKLLAKIDSDVHGQINQLSKRTDEIHDFYTVRCQELRNGGTTLLDIKKALKTQSTSQNKRFDLIEISLKDMVSMNRDLVNVIKSFRAPKDGWMQRIGKRLLGLKTK